MCDVVFVDVDGTRSVSRQTQRDVADALGGDITFVGALPDLQVFVLARKCCEDPINVLYEKHPTLFDIAESPVVGRIAFVASNEAGCAVDVDVHALEERLQMLLA